MKIEGVVHNAASSAAQLPSGAWAGSLLLRPWRRDGGALETTSFYLRLVARKTSAQSMRDAPRYTRGQVISVEVGDAWPATDGRYAGGELSGKVKKIDAADLREVGQALDAAMKIVDETLGRLRREVGATHFGGTFKALGRRLPLTIYESETQRGARVVKEASKAIARVDFEALTKVIVRRLYALTKEWSLTPLTREQFEKKLRIAELRTFVGGAVDVAFDSADVFTDHRVKVSLRNGRVRGVSLE